MQLVPPSVPPTAHSISTNDYNLLTRQHRSPCPTPQQRPPRISTNDHHLFTTQQRSPCPTPQQKPPHISTNDHHALTTQHRSPCPTPQQRPPHISTNDHHLRTTQHRSPCPTPQQRPPRISTNDHHSLTTQHRSPCPTPQQRPPRISTNDHHLLTHHTASFSLSHSTAKASSYQHQQPPPLTDSPHSIVLLVPLHSKGLLARQHMTVKAAMRVLEACDGGACGRWHCFYGACCLHCT